MIHRIILIFFYSFLLFSERSLTLAATGIESELNLSRPRLQLLTLVEEVPDIQKDHFY